MLHKTKQLSVITVATLAIVAVVAVALLAAGGAQAENVTTNALPYESDNDGGNAVQPQRDRRTPTPTPTPPTPRTPEACVEDPDEVFSSDHLALFDVYWDPDDLNLVNNPCPPFADHGEDGTIRTRSDFNVLNGTVVHIPHRDRFKIVNKIPEGGNPSEYFVVDANSPLLRSYRGQSGDKIAWIVAEWPDDVPNRTTGDPDFHFGFSAGLLHPENWVADPENLADGVVIQYEFEAEREPEVRPGDRGAVFASTGATFTPEETLWDTDDPDVNEMKVTPGEYEHLYWAFTKPGTYVFWAHAKGHPKPQERGGALLPAGSQVKTVTSEVVRYTFHVGRMADLGVAVASDNESPAPGGTVTLTVTAHNDGPDDAPNTVVHVELPDGLTADSAMGDTGTYDGTNGGWSIGDLASGASVNLEITATVGANTHGSELTVNSTIGAVEIIGRSPVTELDPNTDDNTGAAVITPTAEPNENVVLGVAGRLAENVSAGTAVAISPWVAYDPDTTAFRYSLTGDDARHFDVDEQTGALSVSADADLNYECKTAYVPRLQVSDGKDEAGNADNWTVDSVLAMVINLDDQQEADPQVQISVSEPDDRGRVTLTPVVTPGGTLCAPLEDYSYVWDGSLADKHRNDAQVTVSPFGNYDRYTVRVTITDANGRSVTVQDSVTLSE